jgi:two-component system, OmpR family, KDP operon response regulator KdpE
VAVPHILLVEDSALVSEALRVLFEETGHRITIAASAAEAIEAGSLEIPDVMLLDLGLPDADGLTVLEALSARGRAPRRTIALTGDGDEATMRRCREAGCDEVLLKPVPPRELLKKVGGWAAG